MVFAMVLRAAEDRRPLDEPRAMWEAMIEAQAVAQDLWTEALSECSQPDDPGEFQERFLRKVFGWCGEQLPAPLAGRKQVGMRLPCPQDPAADHGQLSVGLWEKQGRSSGPH